MNELIEEHVHGRKLVADLTTAIDNLGSGGNTIEAIKTYLEELIAFYPAHIEKEDKHFFYPALDYLNKQEQDAMLREFDEFDKKMIHEKYNNLVEELENKISGSEWI